VGSWTNLQPVYGVVYGKSVVRIDTLGRGFPLIMVSESGTRRRRRNCGAHLVAVSCLAARLMAAASAAAVPQWPSAGTVQRHRKEWMKTSTYHDAWVPYANDVPIFDSVISTHLRSIPFIKAVTMEVVPFQIVYISNDEPNEMMSLNTLTDMTLLQVTRDHLIATDLQLRRAGYQSLALYLTIRTSSTLQSTASEQTLTSFTNGTKIAFTGTVAYETAITTETLANTTLMPRTSNSNELSPKVDVYPCFLGSNATIYVDLLRLHGWNTLQQVHVMTMSGTMVDVASNNSTTDGAFHTQPPSRTNLTNVSGINNASSTSPRTAEQMDQSMSNVIYLLASLLPIAILVVTVSCLFITHAMSKTTSSTVVRGRQYFYHADVTNHSEDWQVNSDKACKLQRWTLESRFGRSSSSTLSPVPSAAAAAAVAPTKNQRSDERTSDNDSVAVAIDSSGQRHPHRVPTSHQRGANV
jgi:hypothetical protein